MNRWSTLKHAVAQHGTSVLVSVAATKGSVPRETDAWMIVTPAGFHGSIGGGTLEWKAMAEAQAMLMKSERKRIVDYVLGPDLGQCCGGWMQLAFEAFDQADAKNLTTQRDGPQNQQRHLYLFGAGHVGRALVLALAPLPFNVHWIDPRPSAFPAVFPQNVTPVQNADCLEILQVVPDGSLTYVMTHSHALDLSIVDTALRNPNVAHVGVIGSATKRARFEKRLAEAGVSPERIVSLICPVGIPGIASKHPAAIAASVVAQVLQMDSALSSALPVESQQRNVSQ
jgi:xanthine dehydrogenase accessory factor